MTSDAPPTNLAAALISPIEKPRTVWRDALRRLSHSRLAILCAAILAGYLIVALIGFLGILDHRIEAVAGASNQPPSFKNISLLLGTDFLGRSVLWRVLYGARIAMTVAISAALLSTLIGTVLGLVAGYFGGWIDNLIIWLFSTVNSVPDILLIMSLAFVLKGQSLHWRGQEIPLVGIPSIVLALGLTNWVGLCRFIRGEAIKLRDRDYVSAARAVSVSNTGILFRHILPNVFHIVIINFSLALGAFVQMEVVLSFLGLGVMDRPSWGRMIDDAKQELLKGVWWQMTAATVAIFIFSLAVNILGDALRDALDPRLRGTD